MHTTLKRIVLVLLLSCCACISKLKAAAIILHTHDAVAWLPQQTISGNLVDFNAASVIVHQDKKTFTVKVKQDYSFSFAVVLHDNTNRIWVEAKYSSNIVLSDMVKLQLAYHPSPVIKPFAIVTKSTAELHAYTVTNPWRKLEYHWTAGINNPTAVRIINPNDSVTRVNIPDSNGVYYFNVAVVSGKDTATFQTFITRYANKLQAFNMDSIHAAWIDDAVIYEITPYAFVKGASYDDITAKLPEIKALGINTIWLQPIFKTYNGGQGYDIIDYFSLRDDLGSEAQLQQLIQTAKALQLKILFDFVPNHTSIHHPYAQDCAAYKTDSHYYHFYQHTDDGVLYSSDYHTDKQGFVYYFWNDLVNLDYSNLEVQQWMLEACKYWVKKYDIDGYRFDAVWGVNARQPDFGKRLQLELKTIKPDLLLLAEDKSAMTSIYTKGFDVAFDWTSDTSWVSQWSWQYDYNPPKEPVIFNHPDVNQRGPLLRKALFHNGDAVHARLRFIENNDLSRLIVNVQLPRTKMAAALCFALPGIPLIYNGQEAGITTTPSISHPTFKAAQSIQSQDKDSLFIFHQQLTALRAAHACLRNNKISEVKISPAAAMVAFHRGNEQEDIVTVINMDVANTKAILDLSTVLKKGTTHFSLTDLMTKEVFTYTNADITKVKLPVNGYSTRIILIGDTQEKQDNFGIITGNIYKVNNYD